MIDDPFLRNRPTHFITTDDQEGLKIMLADLRSHFAQTDFDDTCSKNNSDQSHRLSFINHHYF